MEIHLYELFSFIFSFSIYLPVFILKAKIELVGRSTFKYRYKITYFVNSYFP